MKTINKAILSALMVAVTLTGFSTGASAGQEIVVSAAASLANAFTDIGKDFERANPDVMVLFNFAASGALMQQIIQGAPVDVFASADIDTMAKARGKGVVDASTIKNFAVNKLVLITSKGSAIQDIKELGGESVKRIAIGKPDTVPAGRYTKEALQKYGMWDVLEPKLIYAGSVRQVLDYVSRKEVDAGFVYATDAASAADKVKVVCVAGGHKLVVYPIAAVSSGKNKAAARKFIQYVLSGKGQAVLARYGFTRP